MFFKLDPEIGLSRAFDKDGDKHEKKGVGFFKKIEKGYMKISKLYSGVWKNIDASGNKDEVFSRIKEQVLKLF